MARAFGPSGDGRAQRAEKPSRAEPARVIGGVQAALAVGGLFLERGLIVGTRPPTTDVLLGSGGVVGVALALL